MTHGKITDRTGVSLKEASPGDIHDHGTELADAI